ncbi:hypothetical protein Q9233_013963 [Columba guinea]|nr:hypothetical protein Q9233_013963 [Columba guinea]
MATRGLLEMLDAAIGTPQDGVVDFVVLHKLLKAMIIGQQGQQELSVLEPGQSPTLGLGKGKVTKEKPGQEEKERDICKKRASLQDLWEEINKFKEAQRGLAEDMRAMWKAHSGMAEDIQEIQETLGLPASSRSQATIPGDAQEPAKPWGSTSTSSYESEMREVLSQVGQLGSVYAGLKEEVEQLKSTKAERADLENVRRLFPKGGQESITSILADLKCQMSFLQDMARTLHGEEEKIRKVEDAPRKTRGAGASRKADGSGQMTRQPRSKGQKVKAEHKELGKQQEPTQAELEQFAAKYVNKLVMEKAQHLQAEQPDEPRATVQSGGHEHAGCHFCSLDTRVLLGKLLQRCEKLEEQVESLVQKAGGKVDNYPKWRRQSLQQDEQLKCLQTSIVQLQQDYEKLSLALANLQRDRQQEQNDIKAQGRLEKKQADKEDLQLLGIDEKADKAALADKVSRSQFEACVERLNKMMEEVTSRVTGQEKGWHHFQKELQRQMDCKLAEGFTRPQLDRRELGAFRKQQEERWKSLSGQLQEKALQAERDDAAGIRKQLLPGFHCLSCDRPLNMLAPGPERTGECRYPTVPRSCGGPHTVTPPRFQPQPPSTPRPSPSSARRPNKVIVPILTNKKNHQGWPQVVSQDIVRHVHNLKSTVFTVVGQVDGKTLLPLPAGSEGIGDIDLENEKSMERIDKSLVYAMESAIIDWSHQIQEALKKESSEPLLQGSDPNPKVELEFWKNRYPEQPGQCMVPCGAHFGYRESAALTEAQDVRLHLMPLKCRLEDIERVEFSEVKPFLLPLLHVVCLIWVASKHYNVPVRIVVLLQEICNLLIEQALVYLSPEDLLKGDMEESLGKVRMVLGILNTFKEALEERREKLHTYYEPGQEVREWDFSSTMVFVRLDTFLKRLEMVELHLIPGDGAALLLLGLLLQSVEDRVLPCPAQYICKLVRRNPVRRRRAGDDWLGWEDEDFMDPASQLGAAEEAAPKPDPMDWLIDVLARRRAKEQAKAQETNAETTETQEKKAKRSETEEKKAEPSEAQEKKNEPSEAQDTTAEPSETAGEGPGPRSPGSQLAASPAASDCWAELLSAQARVAELKSQRQELKAKKEQPGRDRQRLDEAWQEMRLEKEKVIGAVQRVREQQEMIRSTKELKQHQEQLKQEKASLSSMFSAQMQLLKFQAQQGDKELEKQRIFLENLKKVRYNTAQLSTTPPSSSRSVDDTIEYTHALIEALRKASPPVQVVNLSSILRPPITFRTLQSGSAPVSILSDLLLS